MRALAVAIVLSLMMVRALITSSQVEAAIKGFQTVDSDANRMKTLCELMQIDEQNEKRTNPSLEAKMDKLLNELGADFEAAWELVEDTDPASEDGKVLHASLDRGLPTLDFPFFPERQVSRSFMTGRLFYLRAFGREEDHRGECGLSSAHRFAGRSSSSRTNASASCRETSFSKAE